MMRPSRIIVIFWSSILITFAVIISKFLFFMHTLDDSLSYAKKNLSTEYKFIGGELKNIEWMLQVIHLRSGI